MLRWVGVLAITACTYAPSPGSAGSDGPPGPLEDGPAPDAAATCTNGVRDPDELDIDCGGTCAACTDVFAVDADVLAVFELAGNTEDTSGNDRHAELIGGSFEPTSWGQGLALPGATSQGLVWPHASLLVHPYTIEMVVTAGAVTGYRKLFGGRDNSDLGWYFRTRFLSYDSSPIGPSLEANRRYYLAFVTTSTTAMTVYLDGVAIGSTPTHLANPPGAAILFRDDTATNRQEALTGVVEAIRISRGSRSETEITAVADRLAAQP